MWRHKRAPRSRACDSAEERWVAFNHLVFKSFREIYIKLFEIDYYRMEHLMPYLVTLIKDILHKCKRSRTWVSLVNQFINTNSVTACSDGETELYETQSQLNQLQNDSVIRITLTTQNSVKTNPNTCNYFYKPTENVFMRLGSIKYNLQIRNLI